MKAINLNKHIWEGWTVGDFINELELSFNLNQKNNTFKLKNRDEVKKWCMDNQPYYKKYIKEVVDYFATKLKQ